MATPLAPGTAAPAFSCKDQHGNPIQLSDFAGHTLVLFFYPKDDTPGCTAEACSLRDNYEKLEAAGLKILGVSVDDEKSHLKFIEKYQLPFPLLADTDKSVVEQFGVWGEKSMYGRKYMGTSRVTFIIGPDGVILHTIEKVQTKDHADQILKLLGK
jgi:peroxiredoxin Q/BCP